MTIVDLNHMVTGEERPLHAVETRPQPRRRMPVKTRRVELTGEYEGWWAVVRTNAPFSLFVGLASVGDADGTGALTAMVSVYENLAKIVLDWNFVDEDGEPLPCDKRGFEAIGGDLLSALLGAVGQAREEAGAVPKG